MSNKVSGKEGGGRVEKNYNRAVAKTFPFYLFPEAMSGNTHTNMFSKSLGGKNPTNCTSSRGTS